MSPTEEMIEELKRLNIKFNCVGEDEAKKYLECNSNYYSLLSYANNFERYYINNTFIDKYVLLDFAYLKDLFVIDQRLRNLLYDMLMEVEFYLKVWIYKKERELGGNGYYIVNDYLDNDYNGEQHLHINMLNKVGKNEYKEILSKYTITSTQRLENIPLWEFMSLITFGELIDFYDYYTRVNNLKKEHRLVYLLRDTLRLRNGVCHNNAILNNLGEKDNLYKPKKEISNYLFKVGIGKKLRDHKLVNSRIRQITSLLYLFNVIVPSDKVKEKVKNKINELILRIKEHKEYYTNNGLLKSTYEYFLTIINSEYKS